MKAVTIYDGERYAITSYGNGWAYCLADKLDRSSVWVQDDDATQFRYEIEALEGAKPEATPDDVGEFLWCDLDYGLVARRDAA